MTVTELREALQALEAHGHGTRRVFIDVASEYFYAPSRIAIGKGHDGEACAIFDDTRLGPYDGSAVPRDA